MLKKPFWSPVSLLHKWVLNLIRTRNNLCCCCCWPTGCRASNYKALGSQFECPKNLRWSAFDSHGKKKINVKCFLLFLSSSERIYFWKKWGKHAQVLKGSCFDWSTIIQKNGSSGHIWMRLLLLLYCIPVKLCSFSDFSWEEKMTAHGKWNQQYQRDV